MRGAQRQPSSAVAADLLTAHFTSHDGVSEIQSLHGDGHTVVHRVSDLGAEDTSAGDVLDATFYGAGHQPVKKAGISKRVERRIASGTDDCLGGAVRACGDDAQACAEGRRSRFRRACLWPARRVRRRCGHAHSDGRGADDSARRRSMGGACGDGAGVGRCRGRWRCEGKLPAGRRCGDGACAGIAWRSEA